MEDFADGAHGIRSEGEDRRDKSELLLSYRLHFLIDLDAAHTFALRDRCKKFLDKGESNREDIANQTYRCKD